MGENPAALRAAVFSLSSKNLRGGGAFKPPPPAGRGLTYNKFFSNQKILDFVVIFSIIIFNLGGQNDKI